MLEDIAVRRTDQAELQGFRLADVFDLWGGPEQVLHLCQDCPANICRVPEINGAIAGCCGWLDPADADSPWQLLVENCWTNDTTAEALLNTRPHWYGLWASGPLRHRLLDFAIDLFARMQAVESEIRDAARRFHQVLVSARTAGLIVDVELVPGGFSDGVVWTIGRHCDRCRAPFANSRPGCPVCGKSGGGHPEIRRRVLGHRPWVPLETVLGKEQTPAFVERYRLDRDGLDR